MFICFATNAAFSGLHESGRVHLTTGNKNFGDNMEVASVVVVTATGNKWYLP